MIILFFPCTVTQLGQFKYGLVKNKITGQVDLDTNFEPGRYWIGFWKEFIEFPSTLCTIEFSDEKPEKGVQHLSKLVSRDSDGKQILLDVSIQYRLRKDNLGKLYKDMTTLYEDVYISDLRDRLSKAANQFTIEQSWMDYSYVAQEMLTRCETVLATKGADCWGLQLWGVTVSRQYTDKIVERQVKTQKQITANAEMQVAQVRAETKYLLSAFTKDVTIVKAKGKAIRINIEREAKAKAEGNLVEAQAKVIKIIKDTVSMYNVTNGNYNSTHHGTRRHNGTAPYMTDDQLVTYQKYTMLQTQDQSHIVVDLADGLGAINNAAAKNLLQSGGRRLDGEL